MRSAMKCLELRTLAVLVAVCPFIMGCPISIVPPAQRSGLPGVWMGEDAWRFRAIYRLELCSDGSGMLGISVDGVQPRARLYEITHWTVDDRGRFGCTLRPAFASSRPVPLGIRGKADMLCISLEVTAPDHPNKWEKGPTLNREADFLKALDQKRKRTLDIQEQMRLCRLDKRLPLQERKGEVE